MKRISVCCLALGFLAALTSAYMVHEEPEEETDETIRGKRQQNDLAVIGNVFNIPITTIKRTTSEKSSSVPNTGVNKSQILSIKADAVTELIKTIQQSKYKKPPSVSSKSSTAETESKNVSAVVPISEIERRERAEIIRRFESQRKQQRIYEEQLRRRRFEQVLQHNKRMQQQILEEEERSNSHVYRSPYSFNALTMWVVGPRGVFNGHAGHGDGHIYQFYNQDKPLHFRGYEQRDNRSQDRGSYRHQDSNRLTRAKSALPLTSSTDPTTISTTPSTTTSTTTSTSSKIKGIAGTGGSAPTHYYEVREVVDEGINTFTWPNWFGIINSLGKAAKTLPDRIQGDIDSKKVKVKLAQLLHQNKIAKKDEDDHKSKYAQARKNFNAPEAELTGNEIDADLESSEKRLTVIERGEKVLLPNN